MRFRPLFAWYDLWIGLFYDRAKRREGLHLGFERNKRPIPGSKASGLRKRMNGQVERR